MNKLKSFNKGFTLIELMVVITIITLLALLSFARYKTFYEERLIKNMISQIQSFVREGLTNATAQVVCGGVYGANWFIVFKDAKNIELRCGTSNTLYKTLTFDNEYQNIQIVSIEGDTGCTSTSPSSQVTITYATLYGVMNFNDSNPPTDVCISTSSKLVVKLTNTKLPSTNDKTITIKKGGEIDIQ